MLLKQCEHNMQIRALQVLIKLKFEPKYSNSSVRKVFVQQRKKQVLKYSCLEYFKTCMGSTNWVFSYGVVWQHFTKI